MYFGQAQQDKFVIKVLKERTNGCFLETGSNYINNLMEKNKQHYVPHSTCEKTINWQSIVYEDLA